MKRIIYTILFIEFLWGNTIFSQNKAELIVNTRVIDNKIEINWYPTDPLEWKTGLKSGYTISREVVSGTNSVFNPQNISPKSKEWFSVNTKSEDGVIFPVGEILYNPDFALPSSDNSEAWNLKYNYVVYEATLNQNIANAVGLGYTDSLIANNAKYRYTIKHNQTGLSNSIEISANPGEAIQVPKDFEPNFTFPDGNSLSYLYQLSQPFVLKAVIGKARPLLDSIVLRWGPSTPEIWRNAMEDGYDIYRIDEKDIKTKVASILPWKEDRFTQIPLSDTLALLAASFVKDKGIPQKMENENFFEKAIMTDNLHGFALAIADRSPLAADILGLRYVDRDVKAGETYVYNIETKRLKSNIPPVDIRITNEFEPLLAPEGFSIQKSDDAVNLRWLSNSNLTKYGSYIVERQNPGDSIFYVITDPPLVFIIEPSIKQPYYHFIDSLHGNKGVFRYRVKGSNAFGEWSEYAYGLGYSMDRTPPDPASLYSGDYQKDSNQIRLVWSIPINNVDIKYHQVLVSENEEYNYSAVSVELPASDTVFYFNVKDMFIDRPFYFKILSVDSSGNQSTSIVRYVSVPDLEKPLAPTNLKVTIDTTGRILATWSPSASHDVEGYYVFYSNDDESDFTMDDNTLQKDTFYTWTIPLNTLTKNIYIAIKAADDNYNRSNFSDIVKLRRPDKIPPPKPFLSQAFYEEESGVYLSWKKSSATDVEKYFIYRKNNKDSLSTWKLIDSTTKEVLEYTDDKYPYDTEVGYSIKASDDFNNISELSNPVPVNIPFPKNKYLVSFQKAESSKNMNVHLTWNKPYTKNMDKGASFKYQIFRSVGNDEIELYKEVTSSETNLTDKIEMKNVLYNYAIRIKFENGKTGKISETKSILIQ